MQSRITLIRLYNTDYIVLIISTYINFTRLRNKQSHMSLYFPAVRMNGGALVAANQDRKPMELYRLQLSTEPFDACDYVDPFPRHIVGEETSDSTTTYLSKNMFYPLEPNKFFSFASVLNLFKIQERMCEDTYVTMTTQGGSLNTETVNGTSFGVALTLVLANITIPVNRLTGEPLIAFTGTIQAIGLREGENVDNIALECVTLTPVKARHCLNRQVILFSPFNEKEPEINQFKNVIIGKTLGYALRVALFVQSQQHSTDWEQLRSDIINNCGVENIYT